LTDFPALTAEKVVGRPPGALSNSLADTIADVRAILDKSNGHQWDP
jgi:hypothetical protein